MSQEQEYLDLNRRLTTLREQHAVLTDREETKRVERERIKAALRKAGVDPDRPDEESERLEREIQDHYAQAKAEVDAFEAALNQTDTPEPEEARAPELDPPKPARAAKPADPEPTALPPVEDEDLDLDIG
jgi:hypothetical protein